MQRNVVTLYRTIGVILCAVCVCADAGTGNEHDTNRAIQDALKKGDCDRAGEIIQKAAYQNKDDPRVPDWYYELGRCTKDPSGFSLLIEEFFTRRISEITSQRSCRDAESYARTIDTKFRISGNFPSWLFSVARCYEKTGTQDRALPIYREIISDYKERDLVVKAKFRINWLTGDRKWIFKYERPLLKAVIEAIKNRDSDALGRFASKSKFYWGYFEEVAPMLFEEKPQTELSRVFRLAKSLQVGEPVYKSQKEIFLQVILPEEELPVWTFWFLNEEGGWQWIGISIRLRAD